MTVEDRTPVNKNLLAPQGIQLFIKRAPNVSYWIQELPIPGIELGVAEHPNPFQTIPYPGEHMEFEELEIAFLVDEDLTNYLEISQWLIALGKPESFEQYAEIAAQTIDSGLGPVSDITAMVTNSKRNINLEVTYKDAFPTALSRINLKSTATGEEVIVATARFKYLIYNIEKL